MTRNELIFHIKCIFKNLLDIKTSLLNCGSSQVLCFLSFWIVFFFQSVKQLKIMSIVINYINIKLYFKEGRETMNVSSVSTSGLCLSLQDVGHCGNAAVQHKTTRTLQRVELRAQNINLRFYIHKASLYLWIIWIGTASGFLLGSMYILFWKGNSLL